MLPVLLHVRTASAAVRTYYTYCCTYVLHLLLYIRTASTAVRTYCTYCCTYVLHLLLYVRTAPTRCTCCTYCWRAAPTADCTYLLLHLLSCRIIPGLKSLISVPSDQNPPGLFFFDQSRRTNAFHQHTKSWRQFLLPPWTEI